MPGQRSAALVTALVLVSACTTVDDQSLTRAQGAGAGAALGAGLGALIGDDPEDALLGAAVGGLAGLAVGDAVARKKASYASTEEMIVEERRLTARQADDMEAYNDGLRRQIALLDQDIEDLEGQAENGRVVHGERLELRRRAEADLDRARLRLAEVSKEIDISWQIYNDVKSEGAPVDMVEWDRRIRELERRRDELVDLIDDVEASRQRIA